MPFDLPPDYKQVPERIADLKALHPDARLRPVNTDEPFRIVEISGATFVVYVAACYRDADDKLPAIGVAWEPFPGKTPYTRDSELMNAETSAWGRAIVAALRSESKAIASAEDVRNRRADQAEYERNPPPASRRLAERAEHIASTARQYLEVPFKDKDRVKAAGARWDANAKSWYIPDGVDHKLFALWIEPTEEVPMFEPPEGPDYEG